MRWSVRLFKVNGISVELHLTFILFAFLILAGGGVESFLFLMLLFVIVLAHEFMHSMTAKFYGIRVPFIILTPIGGLSNIEPPDYPTQELAISIVGPLFNFMLAASGFLIIKSFEQSFGFGSVLSDISGYWSGNIDLSNFIGFMRVFVSMNLLLGGFNMLPAFPMDGGRVLRSVLALWMDYMNATRIANAAGQVIFIGFIIWGVFYQSIILLLIGLVLSFAGNNEVKFTAMRQLLGQTTLSEIADDRVSYVNASLTWREFTSNVYRRGRNTYLIVDFQGLFKGVLDLSQGRGIDSYASIGKSVKADYAVLDGSVRAVDALNVLMTSRIVLVSQTGKIVGYVTPQSLSDYMIYHSLRKSTQ